MNCQEINLILDSHPKPELDANTNRAIEQHLASCESCRDAWSAFDAIATMSVPEMPHGFGSRMAVALAARTPSKPRRVRQSTLLGGVLIVGAAAVASIVVLTGDTATDTSQRIDEAPPGTSLASPQEQSVSQGAEEPPAIVAGADDLDDPDSPGPPIGLGAVSVVALDPYSVAVIVTPNIAAQPDAIAVFKECHGYVLAELNEVAGLNVIAGDRVSAFDGLNLDAAEIARTLGAGVFVELYMPSELASCLGTVVDTATGRLLDGFGGVLSPEYPSERLRSLAQRFVRVIENNILKDADTVSEEVLASFFNAAREDNERVHALLTLRTGLATPLAGVIDEPVKAVLTEIAMTSSDATARSNALYALRGITDPDLIEPLLYALVNDTDEGVRRSAAYSLHYFINESRVEDALDRARSEDPSAQRGEGCCIQTVREAAQRSLLSDEAVIELTIETFMNSALGPLTDRERIRLLTTSPDGRAMFPYPLPEAAARAVYEIGVRSVADSDLRRTVWTMLGHTQLTSGFAKTLVDDLMTHPNDDVQNSAAFALTRHVDDPAVRDVVQRALSEDLSADIRQALNAALEAGDP